MLQDVTVQEHFYMLQTLFLLVMSLLVMSLLVMSLLLHACLTEVDSDLGHYITVAHDCLCTDGGLTEWSIRIAGVCICIAEHVYNHRIIITGARTPEDDTEWRNGASIPSNSVAQDIAGLEEYPIPIISLFILKLKETDVLFYLIHFL